MTRIEFIAIDCSATPAGGKHDNIGASDIRQWHRAKGWRGIGYHYVIKRDGSVEKGRADDQPGAHDPRINARSEEHTPDIQPLMLTSYAAMCLKQKTLIQNT